MIYILCIVTYLAIGGFLAGVFEDISLDEFWWYLAWPFWLLIFVIILIEDPFKNLGRWTLTKLRDIKNRKNK